MTALTRSFRRKLKRRGGATSATDASIQAAPAAIAAPEQTPVEIGPNDPLLAYFQSASEAVDIDALELDSPALRELKAAGVKLAVPLVSQGELIGVLNLGPRLSEQDYSSDDRRLLDKLAAQAAPALRVAQLVREQKAEAATRQRFEQELEVARLIQQNFLPRELPDLPGWQIAAYYRPAREVGGDFYDVIPLPDGRVAFVVGDVTDKGVPAALVMSATRSVLRASAQRLIEPGMVLERVNEHLCPDMPEKMFVTCLYGVLDPSSGHLRFANAGHDLPYVKTADGIVELRARGMPLGLMPGMLYEEKEAVARAGRQRAPALRRRGRGARPRAGHVRLPAPEGDHGRRAGRPGADRPRARAISRPSPDRTPSRRTTSRWSRSSAPRVRPACRRPRTAPCSPTSTCRARPATSARRWSRSARAVANLGLAPARLERLKTAVAEATMNAMEHGNEYRPDRPVSIRVLTFDRPPARSDHATTATPASSPSRRPRTWRRSSRAARSPAAGVCS